MASTSILSQVTSVNSAATLGAISSHITMAWRWAFDLVTTVNSFSRAGLRQLEREADDAVDTGAGHHRHIGGDFEGMALVDAPADPGIFALRVFADDDPVEFWPMTWRKGLVMPGRIRVGRTLAY